MYELIRIIAKATDSNDDDVIQLLGCYSTLDEADLALDAYSNRYPVYRLSSKLRRKLAFYFW